MSLFVTGTDTGVGKTVITAGVVRALRARGHAVGVAKPVQSGAAADDPAGDAAILKRLTGVPETHAEIAPLAFRAALAPLVAARRESRSIERDALVGHVEAIGARYEAIVVEGAGGLLVPLEESWTMADLAATLGFPVLIVARAGLGTVNHTCLTVAAARARGLAVVGVVLNGACDESSPENAEMIERIAVVRVLGRTPLLPEPLSPASVQDMVETHLDLTALTAATLGFKEALRA